MTDPSSPRPPETIYLRKEGELYIVSVVDAPVKDTTFTDRSRAERFAEMFAMATGSQLVINLGEVPQ